MSFIKQSASTVATQIFLMAMGVGTSIIVARFLGPELKGKSALLTLLAQSLYMICSVGMGTAFSFFIAKNRFPSRQITSCALACSLFFGGIGILAFYCSWSLHSNIWQEIPINLVFSSCLLALGYIYANYLSRILVGFNRIYTINASDSLGTILNFFVTLLLLCIWQFGLYGYVGAQFAGVLGQLFIFFWVLRKDLVPSRFWGNGLIKEGIAYGIKSHGLLLINFLNYRIDILLLKHFSNDTAVGFYSLAVGMAELMWLVPNATVAPLFSGVAASEAADRSMITMRTVRWSLLFLSALSVGGIFLGRPFIHLLYGAAFLPSYLPFLWLLPGICLFPIFKLLGVDLAARGYPGFGTIASAIALLTNIFANILLIPHMGITGAALASTLSYSCMSLVCLSFFIRVTGCRVRDVFLFDSAEKVILGQYVAQGYRWIMAGGKREK